MAFASSFKPPPESGEDSVRPLAENSPWAPLQHGHAVCIVPNAASWMTWLQEQAASQGFLDVRSLAAACGFAQEQLAGWAAASQGEPPVFDHILRVSRMLHVDPYDLLVAAGWVEDEERANQAPEFRIDGNVTSVTWRGDPPTGVS